MTDASVVVITKNQRRFLERSLPALAGQRPFAPEVIVVDSGSTDGAREFVRGSGARLVSLTPGAFSYARAHNAGAEAAVGTFVVRLSGDAVPASPDWLSCLIEPLRADSSVAAAWGGQILPKSIRNPVERLAQRLYYDSVRPRPRWVRHTRPATVLGCNMAVRRALWAAHPYDESLPQAEDYAWLNHFQRRGYAGVFVPDAAVVHGHDEPLPRAVRRALAQSTLQGLIRVGILGR